MKSRGLVYTSAIVVIPPEEIWPAIQQIRLRYDQKVRRWMPHITMIYPFWPLERFPEAGELLRPVCQRFTPFSLTLRRFDTFDHGRGKFTMWLDPEPNEPLEILHGALAEALNISPAHRALRHRFRPHLSVGQIRGQADRERILAELTAHWQPLTFVVDNLAFIWRNHPPDDIFRVGLRIPLASGEPTHSE